MALGQRIRSLRIAAELTQKELGEASGVTESAIRNYELGIRTPKPATLDAIADALDVPYEALQEVTVDSARGALELLFQAERQLGLKPVVEDGRIAIEVDHSVPGSQKTEQALKAWQRMQKKLDSREVTGEEYELWKARFRM